MPLNVATHSLFSGMIATSWLTTLIQAQALSGFAVTANIGHYKIEDDRDIKSRTSSLGSGYQVDPPWEVKLVALNSKAIEASTPAFPVIEAVEAGAEPSLAEQAALVEALPKITMEIQFDNNQSQVAQGYYPTIEKLADYLKANPNTTVVIEGHTDDSGQADDNQRLSEQRAQAIADLLVNTFAVSEKRVSAIGYGEDNPLVKNDTAEHRKMNRRVVAVISSNQT